MNGGSVVVPLVEGEVQRRGSERIDSCKVGSGWGEGQVNPHLLAASWDDDDDDDDDDMYWKRGGGAGPF